MSKKRKTIISVCLVAIIIAVMIICYLSLKPDISTGLKKIVVDVIHLNGEIKTFEIVTSAEYLRDALEQENLLEGVESQYGLWIQTVDGETADEDLEQWWGYNVNGELGMYGVESQPVNDGDYYEFRLNEGY